MPNPVVLLNAVGLTPRLLPHAARLSALAKSGWMRPVREVLPAVTTTAQATILTGQPPRVHGIVGNGWLFRETGEVRFWQQSNRLIQAEPIYATLRRQRPDFRCAKLFWWYNQGADVAISVTPKPYYGADGNKAFGITGTPEGLSHQLEAKLGAFPFPSFWGPMAGPACTRWIAQASAAVLRDQRPDLSLVYLPHLDYDPQRFGPSGCDMPRLVKELDEACEPMLEAAHDQGAAVWVVSEYGHLDVNEPRYPNRVLREAGLLTVRDGPFGETLDTFTSRAFAVCDHQLAHIYIREKNDIPHVRELLAPLGQVAEPGEVGLDHPRSGELILLASPQAWYAYRYWLDDRRAPDFARTVDIHRKPGYDPCELFFDPKFRFPKLHAARRLLAKKLGFRILMDVVPLDARFVRGSHGIHAPDPLDRPLLIGSGNAPEASTLEMTHIYPLLRTALEG
jgi:predicted AlkP superfamily pyrophosphatase or phosphodiesterase